MHRRLRLGQLPHLRKPQRQSSLQLQLYLLQLLPCDRAPLLSDLVGTPHLKAPLQPQRPSTQQALTLHLLPMPPLSKIRLGLAPYLLVRHKAPRLLLTTLPPPPIWVFVMARQTLQLFLLRIHPHTTLIVQLKVARSAELRRLQPQLHLLQRI
jgi:hypothetical protein